MMNASDCLVVSSSVLSLQNQALTSLACNQKQKSPGRRGFDAIEVISLSWGHIDGVLVQSTLDGEGNLSVNQRKQGVVLTDANIDARMELGATLANNDAPCVNHFATELLDTQHFGLRVAPVSRRAAAFFLCHFPLLLVSCLTGDRADLQFSEILPMTLALLVVLATAHLEDAHFVVPTMGQDCDCDCCTGHQGRTNFNITAGADSQYLVDNDLLAYVRSNLFYFNFFTSSNFVLFATGFYDRVHVRPRLLSSADGFPQSLTL
jgi:hypothetical protein